MLQRGCLTGKAHVRKVVSGALDRLHYEADPCVKYDSARKVWIYLHRHRSESEFGMRKCVFLVLIHETFTYVL